MAGFSRLGDSSIDRTPCHSVAGLHAEFSDRFDLIDSRVAEHVTPWGAAQSFTFVLLRRVDRC